ncbi:MAG: 30S ribosomal protein S8 [Acidimicrobiia bacterium]|nr:30S ribosomal protein S8 [Acidimicrobiia bacterium]
MNTDPIADMLTRIRNANAVQHASTSMPASKVKANIARILASEGFIDSFEVKQNGVGSTLTVKLRYGQEGEPALQGIRRVSSPGRRVYRKSHELPRAQGGLGVVVISTSQGMMADRDARRRKLGGEIICEVW